MLKRWSIGLVLVMLLLTACAGSCAETERETVWVLCQPDSYVNIRSSPGRRGGREGFAWCGDDFTTDGKEKHGFLHVYCPTESGEGWIALGYISRTEPEESGKVWTVQSSGRVAVRATIGGRRTRWVRNGRKVTVYCVGDMAVTNLGFIDPRYLTEEEESNAAGGGF